jgi:TolA-binding protein
MKTLLAILLSTFIYAQELSEKNREEMALLKQQVSQLTERVDGLVTLIEGFNSTIGELKAPVDKNLSEQTQMRISVLEAKVDLLSKGMLTELPQLDEENITNKPKEEILPKLSQIPTSKLYTQGVRLFLRHKYGEAKERFLITVEKNYKRASSNYYLGEIAYSTKEYKDAISYFKKSIEIYDSANYNDLLLLHSAISLEKIGDKQQAKNFYEMIIETYPKKQTATTARDRLQKL